MPAKGVGIAIMPAKRDEDSAGHACRKGLFEIFLDADVHTPSMGMTPGPPGFEAWYDVFTMHYQLLPYGLALHFSWT
jgi:hypothetical protein